MKKKEAEFPPLGDASADEKGPRHFRGFLLGTFHHYSALLPPKFSFLLHLILRFLFGSYSLSESDVGAVKAAAERGPILYVARDRSRLEYLATMWVLAKHDLPVPHFAHYVSMYLFQPIVQTLRRAVSILVHFVEHRTYPNPYRSGYLKRLIGSGAPSLLFVSDFRSVPRRFGSRETDILTEIFRCQREMPRPIQVVPIVFIYGTKPDREINTFFDLVFGPTAHPGGLRLLWMALRYRKKVTVRACEIDSLENMVHRLTPRNVLSIDRSPELAYLIRRRLIELCDEERRVVLGPIRKSRSEMVEAALHNRALVQHIREYSRDNNMSFVETRARARRYLDEMAADYSPTVVGFAEFLLRWVLARGKGEIRVEGGSLENVRKTARRMPLVYVPCHKSHFDYLLVSFVLYQNKLSLPFILSGLNLNRWPYGGLFRRCGAFFLRRAFKGKRIYSKSVAAYVETLLRESVNLEFFIEGGRSRIGKILPPKVGFISILLDAFKNSGRQDMAFVPVTIDYERIFEEKFYLADAAHAPSAAPSGSGNKLKTVIENRRMIRRRIGDIHLAFSEPVVLTDLLREIGASEVPEDRVGQMVLAQKIAFKVTWEIAKKSLVRPYAIVATVLLANPRRGLLMDDLVRDTRLLLEYLSSRGIRIVGDVWGLESNWPQRLADLALREKWIRVEPGEEEEEETIIFLEESLRLPLTIHRNTILHFYQWIALLSLAFRASGGPAPKESLYRRFLFAKDLLSSEMIYGPAPAQTPEENGILFDEALEYFTGKGFVAYSDQGLVLTSKGSRAASLFASILTAFLESYYVVASTLIKYHKKETSDRDWVRRAMKRGRFLLGLGEITFPESVHKAHYETAFRQFSMMGYCLLTEQVLEKSRVSRTIKAGEVAALEELQSRIKDYLQY